MIEKRFKVTNISSNGLTGLFWLGKDNLSVYDVTKLLNDLVDENEQLQARNNRQARRLAELYELMAKKDWESLTEIIDDFCSCEEQLQREWTNYSDAE